MSMVTSSLGVVVIGRNEGERLRQCLTSLSSQLRQLVYVDSGSIDGSVCMARAMGVDVINLDLHTPFTAARARNQGFERLLFLYPHIEYVQFVDGDCEVIEGWLSTAVAFMTLHDKVGVVSGRRRERYPKQSVYNTLCDIEWDTPVGEAKACGGDALIRVVAFTAACGYRSDLIAGEEPDLCVRLRKAGWVIWRIDEEMTLHDAAIMRFGQWWKRNIRAGYAFAEGAALHGNFPERYRVRESLRPWLWGMMIPIAIVYGTILFGLGGLVLFLVYPAQIIRIALNGKRSRRENWLYAVFAVVSKFPELLGQLKYLLAKIKISKVALIEYK